MTDGQTRLPLIMPGDQRDPERGNHFGAPRRALLTPLYLL